MDSVLLLKKFSAKNLNKVPIDQHNTVEIFISLRYERN